MKEYTIMITDPKRFFFNFDQPKDVHKNLNHDIGFLTKSNEYKTTIKCKNKK